MNPFWVVTFNTTFSPQGSGVYLHLAVVVLPLFHVLIKQDLLGTMVVPFHTWYAGRIYTRPLFLKKAESVIANASQYNVYLRLIPKVLLSSLSK